MVTLSSMVGTRIKQARVARGWSRAQFAKLLGVSRQAVMYWEHGSSLPKSDRIREVAVLLGLEVADLVPHAEA
jgi:transcriptional regulator with XRE-family HTH domain